MILLHRATCKGCSVAAFESEARFHWAGRAIPVSSYLIPLIRNSNTCEFIDLFDHLSVLFFQLLDGFGIGAHPIGFEKIDFGLI